MEVATWLMVPFLRLFNIEIIFKIEAKNDE